MIEDLRPPIAPICNLVLINSLDIYFLLNLFDKMAQNKKMIIPNNTFVIFSHRGWGKLFGGRR